jgi:hypothetical protein
MAKHSWQEEAWESLLRKLWDTKGEKNIVEYTKEDLDPILSKYTKSGQGEIRIFHSSSTKIEALRKRGVSKLPLTRSKWILFEAPPKINFKEPKEGGLFEATRPLTEGMILGIKETLNTKSSPGETTMLAIASQSGLISDFYNLSNDGVLFTGGRQKASFKIIIGDQIIDMTSAQIEIDGGFEWPNDVVIVEMKSRFTQPAFDTNQALLPLLKWKNMLKNKNIHSLVLLAETNSKGIEYWAYDISLGKSSVEGVVSKSKKYILEISK